MKDLIKLMIIYSALLMIISIFDNYFKVKNLYCLKVFLVQIVVMMILFSVMKVESRSIMIFLGIMTFFMFLIALDSNVLFGEYADLGLYVEEYIVPYEIAIMAALISKPFCMIFGVLEEFNIVHKSIFMIPIIMFIITYASMKIAKKFEQTLVSD